MPAEAVGSISQIWTQSQIDTADNPENLEFIGWGPRATAQSIEAPGQWLSLKSIDEGAGTLLIEWKQPARGSGGKCRFGFRLSLCRGLLPMAQVAQNSPERESLQVSFSLLTILSTGL